MDYERVEEIQSAKRGVWMAVHEKGRLRLYIRCINCRRIFNATNTAPSTVFAGRSLFGDITRCRACPHCRFPLMGSKLRGWSLELSGIRGAFRKHLNVIEETIRKAKPGYRIQIRAFREKGLWQMRFTNRDLGRGAHVKLSGRKIRTSHFSSYHTDDVPAKDMETAITTVLRICRAKRKNARRAL